MKNDPLSLVSQRILESQRIVITSHLRPDGDSICTSLALAFMGELLGKEVEIINKDNTPFPFIHFPNIDLIDIGEMDERIILLFLSSISPISIRSISDKFLPKVLIWSSSSNAPMFPAPVKRTWTTILKLIWIITTLMIIMLT